MRGKEKDVFFLFCLFVCLGYFFIQDKKKKNLSIKKEMDCKILINSETASI